MSTDTDEYTLAPVTHAAIGRALRRANGQSEGIDGGRYVYDGEAVWWVANGSTPDVVATTVVGQGDGTRKMLVEPETQVEYPAFWDSIHDEVEGER